MKNKILCLSALICIAAFSFAQEADSEVPSSILNNQYFQQSVRLNEQARTAFEEGNYDVSVNYAEQAAEYARRSDEYVSRRLADIVFPRAQTRYVWAGSVGAETRYPVEYQIAAVAYNEAEEARKEEDWNTVCDASDRVLYALADVRGPNGETGPSSSAVASGSRTTAAAAAAEGTLPAQYTVRLWNETGDCFSTIAGWPWVYDDPYEWRRLYEANKNKLPNPNNPNLILPGMILDIPSIKGETRSGMWDPAAKY